jgi:hypothetical protein
MPTSRATTTTTTFASYSLIQTHSVGNLNEIPAWKGLGLLIKGILMLAQP